MECVDRVERISVARGESCAGRTVCRRFGVGVKFGEGRPVIGAVVGAEKRFLLVDCGGLENTSSALEGVGHAVADAHVSSCFLLPGVDCVSVFIAFRGVSGRGAGMAMVSAILDISL